MAINTPQSRYDAGHTTRVALKLNNRTDADLLTWLSSQPNKQGAIKAAVREIMKTELTGVIDARKE